MAVSNDFLTKLDELVVITDEPCTCENCKSVTCPSCFAKQELDGLYDKIGFILEVIKTDIR